MNATHLKSTLKKAFQMNHQLLIVGEPGVGKSDIIHQATEEAGMDLILMHPSVGEPTDVKGFPWCITNPITGQPEARFVTYGEMAQLLNPTKRTVCCFDDVGQSSEQMQAALMQVLLARRINEHRISDNVVFVGATNDLSHKSAVSGFIEPFKSRWYSKIWFTPTIEDWVNWAYVHNQPNEVISFIRFKPSLLNAFVPSKDLKSSPCPRTVAMVGRMLLAKYPQEVMFELGSGAVGEGWMTEYSAFMKQQKDLFDLKLALTDPKNAPVPKESSVLYSVVTGLARMIDTKNYNQASVYIERLPKEFGVLLMRDLSQTNPKEMLKLKTYQQWLLDNKVYIHQG
jgi:DNA polymerase III delta prime subunit